MMSPLSVATYLPKDSAQFDVVIFDEASQVPAEEAIGAILRGAQLVVAGDNKQLPPTRFFERAFDNSDDYVDEDDAPLESLLDDCSAAGIQQQPLEWHYRSKHESLIAFSNAEFYQNSLITFPAPVHARFDALETGVQFSYVENGVYDRGRSKTNREEARRVADLVREHFDSNRSSDSLGVIALSTAQEDAIREEIDRLVQIRPDLEQFLHPSGSEPFFVKPLENVQGDERDSIIISVGYGRDSTGEFSLNFGPINQEGGERRLNVAITRARQQLILVASIQASDIDESRVSKAGPKLLKKYLQFAKEGRLPAEIGAPSGESESDFELAVWEALKENGLDVDRQVGCSRYRIDLAIRNPQKPGRYLLGVECDGDKYHRSAVARDRDRLRQEVLESLGWRIHRIWSTDWIRDPKGCLKRLLYRIEDLGADSQPEPPLRHPPETLAPTEPQTDPAEELDAESFASDEDPYAGQVDEYAETPPSRRQREEFYDGDDRDVAEDVLKTVSHEGPLHTDLIVQRVARMYQLARTGGQIEAIVRRQIARLTETGGPLRKVHDFVWSAGESTVRPRRPRPGTRLRAIEHVPPEEIQAAALLVARLSGGITLEELVPEVTRVLGYQRTGANIDDAVRRSILRLRASDRLAERGSFLVVQLLGESQSDVEADGHSAEPVNEPPALNILPEPVLKLIQTHGWEVFDKRANGGALWVIADYLAGRPLQLHGFQFSRNGGKATSLLPGWYSKPKWGDSPL